MRKVPPEITVHTGDHGPVTIPEPAWCIGTHMEVAYRSDITHIGPDAKVTVGTSQGPRELLTMFLTQSPYTILAPGSDVYVGVHLADGEHYSYGVNGLEQLAEDLVKAAGRVRLMARRLHAEDRPETGR